MVGGPKNNVHRVHCCFTEECWCSMCKQILKDNIHLLRDCYFAKQIWIPLLRLFPRNIFFFKGIQVIGF